LSERFRNEINDSELVDLYCNQLKSISEISKIINTYSEKISKRLKHLNILIRDRHDKSYYKKKNKEPCLICNKNPTQEYMNTGKFYCDRHYTQMLRDGKIKERTVFDSNEIHILDSYIIVYLYNSKNNVNGETYIDLDSIEVIKQYKWRKDRQGYAVTDIVGNDGKRHRMSMHRLLMNPKPHELIDHINFDKSDNRKANLRIVTKSQNEMHKLTRTDNSSGTKGVSYYKGKNLWVAEIVVSGKRVFRKGYINKEDAIKAREEAEKLYHGEYSPLLNK